MAIELSHATFADRIGETFTLSRDEFPTISLELDEVVDLSKPDRKLPQNVRKDPFQLTFRGPLEPLLPQGPYTLSHETMGEVQLFVVPGGPEGEHQIYNVTVN